MMVPATGFFRDRSHLKPDIQKRIAVERRIVKLTVKTLLKAGWKLSLHNGGDSFEITDSTDEKAILSLMMETDDERLYATKEGKKRQWVYFIYGEDGWDVINDTTIGLEEDLKPVTELVDKLCDQFCNR